MNVSLNFIIFTFFILISSIIIIYYITKPIKEDICLENKLIYNKTLTYLLSIYIIGYVSILYIVFQQTLTPDIERVNMNMLLLAYGIITIITIIIISIKIYPKKIEYFIGDLCAYASLIPLFILACFSLTLSYIGILIKEKKAI